MLDQAQARPLLATASLEMVAEYDAFVRHLAAELTPSRGRLAVDLEPVRGQQ